MSAVLASIKPRHTTNIKAGKKTLEVRKTKPNIPTPFKVYVYETKDGGEGAGAVVCEFVCDYIRVIDAYDFIVREDAEKALKGSELTPQEAKNYAGWKPGTPRAECKPLYGWHISELKVYDVPRGLGEFAPHCRFMTDDMLSCDHRKVACNCQHFDLNPWPDCSLNAVICKRRMKRPPQSWCYVEEVLM